MKTSAATNITSEHLQDGKQLAILIPCYNEAPTIAKVVGDFQREFPESTIFVFDNRSTDGSGKIASSAGATTIYSPKRGKGNVVQHMFDHVEADYYLMVDADDTYPASAGKDLVKAFETAGADMVVGMRLGGDQKKAFRPTHKAGNQFVAWLISTLFSYKVTDVLSGYRVFSRDFVKYAFLRSEGFEIETELTIQCLSRGFKIIEVPVPYRARPAGSVSKLNTYLDGAAIIKAIFLILKAQRPGFFFAIMGSIAFIAGLLTGWTPILDYIRDGYVYHLPLAVLAAALEVISVLCFAIGLVLGHITRLHNETQAALRMILKHKKQNSR